MRTKTVALTLFVSVTLADCAASFADCWPELMDGHNHFYYEFDKINRDMSKIREARMRMRNQLQKCMPDRYLAQTSALHDVTAFVSLMDIAVMADDPDTVSKLAARLASGEIVEPASSTLEYGGFYLEGAAYFESKYAVRELLKLGFDPNSTSELQMTPLHSANVLTENGLELIRDLVMHEAKIDIENERGLTPIMMARMNGDLAKAQCLFSLGAKLPTISDFDDFKVGESRKVLIAEVDDFLFSPNRQVPASVSRICSLAQ